MDTGFVIGLGGAGVNIGDSMAKAAGSRAIGIVRSTDAGHSERAGFEHVLRTRDAGGAGERLDASVLSEAVRDVRDCVAPELKSARRIALVVGLGGELSRVTPDIAQFLYESGAEIVVYGTTPFHFEGSPRRQVAERVLKALHRSRARVVVEENQSLVTDPGRGATMSDSFRSMSDRFVRHWLRQLHAA